MAGTALGGAVKVYYDPSIDKIILRKARNKIRAPRLKEIISVFGEKAKNNTIAKTCKGKKRTEFYACLRREGKSAIPKFADELKAPKATKEKGRYVYPKTTTTKK